MTLKAGIYTLAAASGFNPGATQTFTGNMFITNSGDLQISNTVAVPEPSTAALLIGGGALAFTLARRRFRKA